MGERYWITGVQLGMLTAIEGKRGRKNLMKSIVDKQFVERDEYFIITRKQLMEFMFEYNIDCCVGGSKIPSNWLNNTIKKMKLKEIKEEMIFKK